LKINLPSGTLSVKYAQKTAKITVKNIKKMIAALEYGRSCLQNATQML